MTPFMCMHSHKCDLRASVSAVPMCMCCCACRTLQFAHSVADVVRMGEGPKVVLATGEGMDYGMARQLLLHWGTNARNAVIFTQQPRVSTNRACRILDNGASCCRLPGSARLCQPQGRYNQACSCQASSALIC